MIVTGSITYEIGLTPGKIRKRQRGLRVGSLHLYFVRIVAVLLIVQMPAQTPDPTNLDRVVLAELILDRHIHRFGVGRLEVPLASTSCKPLPLTVVVSESSAPSKPFSIVAIDPSG